LRIPDLIPPASDLLDLTTGSSPKVTSVNGEPTKIEFVNRIGQTVTATRRGRYPYVAWSWTITGPGAEKLPFRGNIPAGVLTPRLITAASGKTILQFSKKAITG